MKTMVDPIEGGDGQVPLDQNNNAWLKWTKKIAMDRIPSLKWLPNYDWKENLMPDAISGFTVACIHIPQGLAFAVLANVDPILGLYTACFSTLVYTFFGTAHVSSFGPVAVASMLIGESIAQHSDSEYTNNEIATAITFAIGIYYMIAFALRLGVLAAVFTKPFTSGFICGCTIHIVVKSIKLLLGMHIKTEYGFFNLFKNMNNLYFKMPETNIPTLIISIIVLVILTLNMLVLKPLMRKITKVIIPVEAIVMIVTALLSYLYDFAGMGIPIVGHVPMGLPELKPPSLQCALEMWASALTVAAINYSTTTSMTIMFNKSAEPGQELFALSVSNLICCNLQCIQIGNSMMRTVIAVTLGVKTLVSSMVSSFVLFFVILFAGPLFSPLPDCILGCVIMIGTVMIIIARFREAPSIFRNSVEDGLIWLMSLLFVLIVDIQFGLIVGAVLSLRKLLDTDTAEVDKPSSAALIEHQPLKQNV